MKRNLFKLLLATALMFFSVAPTCFGAELNVRAYIDGRSRLVIQGGNVWWHHLEFAAPGRHSDADEPTYLNSDAWMPQWPSPGENSSCDCDSSRYTDLSPTLARDGAAIQVSEIDVRDQVSIIQQPSGGNGYTAIVEFYDGDGGSTWYEINITYSGSDSTSIPTLSEWGMIFMSLMIAGSAFWMIRRRRIS